MRLTYYVSSFSSGGGRCPNPTLRASKTRYHCFCRAFIGRLKGFSPAALLPLSLSILTSFPFYAEHSARYQISLLAHRRAFAMELKSVWRGKNRGLGAAGIGIGICLAVGREFIEPTSQQWLGVLVGGSPKWVAQTSQQLLHIGKVFTA